MLAIETIAIIAMQAHHGLNRIVEQLRRHKSDRRGQARKRLGLVVRHAQPAAQRQIVALQLLALEDRDDAEIVGQHVDGIILRRRQPHLEFARQIWRRKSGSDLLSRIFKLLAVQPRLDIAA